MALTISHKVGIRDILKYVVPLIVSVGLCWLLFHDIDFGAMIDIVRHECSYGWIVLCMCIAVLSHVFRAMRWGIQLRALGIDAPLYVLVYSIFGTYAVNLVFPRLGEVWRCGYIAGRQQARFAPVFGSMVADRLADTCTVGLIVVLTFILAAPQLSRFLAGNSGSYASLTHLLLSPWLWGAFAAALIAGWYLIARSRFSAKIREALKELWHGFAVVLHMPGRGRWILLVFAVWACYFLQLYVTFYAFPFTREVLARYGITAALVTFVLSSISMGVPSNGGIGPWQWAVIIALGFYGVAREPAAAFANLVLGSNTLLIILLGLITFAGIALDRKHIKKFNTNHNP